MKKLPLVLTSLTLGQNAACGIAEGGVGYCWGDNAHGTNGDGTDGFSAPNPRVIAGGQQWKMLASGASQVCGLNLSGEAFCWGEALKGRLGTGVDDGSTVATPQRVLGGRTFEQISAGEGGTCALTAAGDAFCWGGPHPGNGTVSYPTQPTAVSGGLKFKRIAVGQETTCAITLAGEGYCWGRNDRGQVGDGTKVERLVPTRVGGGFTFSRLVSGGCFNKPMTCGLTTAGKVHCWGYNNHGILGAPETTATPIAVAPALTFNTLSISAPNLLEPLSCAHLCGVTADGAGHCLGNGWKGVLGNDAQQSQAAPVAVSGGQLFERIEAGEGATCGLNRAGQVFCWGDKDRIGGGGEANRGGDAWAPVPVNR